MLCYTAYICTEAERPNAALFVCQAKLCNRFLPAFPCTQQPAPWLLDGRWELGTYGDGEEFGLNGDLAARVGHLQLI